MGPITALAAVDRFGAGDRVEVEDLRRHVVVGVRSADEGSHAATGYLLDRAYELLLAGVLEEGVDVPDSLVFAELHHPML